MGMPATDRHDWTVDMLDALPDDGQRYEIIDGELAVTPAPGLAHQLVLSALHPILFTFLDGSDVGRVLMSPSDVRSGPRRAIQPDLFVVRFDALKARHYPFAIRDRCWPSRSCRRRLHGAIGTTSDGYI